MAQKKRRRFSPRFFLFLLVTVAFVVGVIVLWNVIGDAVKKNKAESSLQLPVDTPSPSSDANTTVSSSTGTRKMTPLDSSGAYPVTGSGSGGLSTQVRVGTRDELYDSNPQAGSLSFGGADSYSSAAGVLTFGGNHYRNTFSYGTASVTLKTLTQKWSAPTGSLGDFAGMNWTGQALVIQWDKTVLPTLGVVEAYRAVEGFTEVIYPSADGKIYFYELDTGNETREPINIGVTMLGTPSLDPNGYPMLYVGQGNPSTNSKGNTVAYMYAVNLITNQVVYEFGGKDYFALRGSWNAYDSSPLVIGDTLIYPCETGVLYTCKLNTSYSPETGTITIDPGERIKYRYTSGAYSGSDEKDKLWYGFESSAAAFRNCLFITDNGGYLQCIDINSLTLKYAVSIGGDSDASVVIEEDGAAGTIYLYTVSQTSTASAALPEGYGYCYVTKLDGLTGQVLWQQEQPVYVGDGSQKGGGKATPHIGRDAISDLLICSFYGAGVAVADAEGAVSYSYGGRIVAFDRLSGGMVWSIEQLGDADYVSSPLVVYSERGDAYLIACDRAGNIKLYDASKGGNPLCETVSLGARIDATPVAFGNYIVVGTTGRLDGKAAQSKIVGLKIE